MQWVCAVLLLSKPLCVCICVFGSGEKWGAGVSISTCIHSPDPTDASFPPFLPLSLFLRLFLLLLPLPELFLLPSHSLSAVAHSSPLPISFLLRILHFVVGEDFASSST